MTTPVGTFTPYSTLKEFFPGAKPTWIPDELDQERILSYQLYEMIYWGVPDAFKLTWRGTADKPIYLPSAKTIVETLHRYIFPNPTFYLKPTVADGAVEGEIIAAQEYLDDFFTRETFMSKLNSGKRYGLIRGDWLWYVTADPLKLPGTRVSLKLLDPGSYFPIFNPDDIDQVIGLHIVDQFIPQGSSDVMIKRTTYRKPGFSTLFPKSPFITVAEAIFNTDDWGGPASKPTKTIRPEIVLDGIPTLPVYHVKNFDEPANPFGSSELRGMERLITALNQGISDEELSLALDGLGMYSTTAPSPTDDQNNKLNWVLGPGRVVERPMGTEFTRVNGIGAITPYSDHLNFLLSQLREGSGTPDIAVGAVDVTVAQSGVALSLQFAPILAKTDEKDSMIQDKHAQMMFDLTQYWFPVYEQTRFDGMRIKPLTGDKLPVDRDQRLTELDNMLDRNVITTAYYRQEASKLGFTFPEGMTDEVAQEKAQFAKSEDPYAIRTQAEIDAAALGATDPTLV